MCSFGAALHNCGHWHQWFIRCFEAKARQARTCGMQAFPTWQYEEHFPCPECRDRRRREVGEICGGRRYQADGPNVEKESKGGNARAGSDGTSVGGDAAMVLAQGFQAKGKLIDGGLYAPPAAASTHKGRQQSQPGFMPPPGPPPGHHTPRGLHVIPLAQLKASTAASQPPPGPNQVPNTTFQSPSTWRQTPAAPTSRHPSTTNIGNLNQPLESGAGALPDDLLLDAFWSDQSRLQGNSDSAPQPALPSAPAASDQFDFNAFQAGQSQSSNGSFALDPMLEAWMSTNPETGEPHPWNLSGGP